MGGRSINIFDLHQMVIQLNHLSRSSSILWTGSMNRHVVCNFTDGRQDQQELGQPIELIKQQPDKQPMTAAGHFCLLKRTYKEHYCSASDWVEIEQINSGRMHWSEMRIEREHTLRQDILCQGIIQCSVQLSCTDWWCFHFGSRMAILHWWLLQK